MMKSRKVVTRSGRKFRGYFPSKKLGRMVEWESLLERDAILLFEFSTGVKSYQEQPELIYYQLNDEIQHYYPDFSITLSSGEILHLEVKPKSKFSSMELIDKFNAIINNYNHIGRDFKILIDEHIRVEPRLTNLKRLARVLHHHPVALEAQEEVIELLKGGAILSVASLSKIIGLTSTLVLLAHGVIYCDINTDFNIIQNFLRLPKEDDHDALFI